MHRAEYAHHVSIARGSLYEVQSVLYVAMRANRLTEAQCAESLKLINSIGRMLTSLLRALYRKPPSDRGE